MQVTENFSNLWSQNKANKSLNWSKHVCSNCLLICFYGRNKSETFVQPEFSLVGWKVFLNNNSQRAFTSSRMFTFSACSPRPSDAYDFAQPDILSATGIMAFAFMCHHNTFLIYHSMRDSSQQRWEKVTHISVGWVLSAFAFVPSANLNSHFMNLKASPGSLPHFSE